MAAIRGRQSTYDLTQIEDLTAFAKATVQADTSVYGAMLKLDEQLGLGPQAAARLRHEIVDDAPEQVAAAGESPETRRGRLRVAL